MIPPKKYYVLIALLLSINYLAMAEYSSAEDYLERKQKALNIINDFAEKYCIEVKLEGRETKATLSADGKVKLNNFLKKIFDLEIGVGGKYEISEYSGNLI